MAILVCLHLIKPSRLKALIESAPIEKLGRFFISKRISAKNLTTNQ